MLEQEFYCLTLLYGLMKLTDINDKSPKNIYKQYNKNLRIASLKYLIQDNEYFQTKENLINKLYDQDDNDPYIAFIKEAERILSSQLTTTSQSNDPVLESIFNKVFPQKKDPKNTYAYQFKELSLQNIFPQQHIQKDSRTIVDSLDKHIISLKTDLKKVDNEEKLYYLLQKYLWCIPIGNSSISLFDYIKSLSCIALCLYKNNEDKEVKLENINDKEDFLLINGDISGIQDFIFSISSKGAAKSLKGRSVYLNLLQEVIVKHILDELELYDTSVIYIGGGNFYIIAPSCKREKLEKLRSDLADKLLYAHKGKIYLALSYIEFKTCDFNDFTNNWTKVNEETSKLKRIKWSELGLFSNYEKVFGPLDDGALDKKCCTVCGISETQAKITSISESENICELCSSFRDLTDKLKNARYISFNKVINNEKASSSSYINIFRLFGYEVNMYNKYPNIKDSSNIYIINSTDYLDEGCVGFKFGAYNLPFTIDKGDIKERVVTFDELAQKSIYDNGIGDAKLGYLKLDVDNLGNIFINGLKENKSILHIASLSRMLSIFFEGYINTLIDQLQLKDKIYVVFSGGDDTFIIGAWNHTLTFCREFHDKFEKYTCFNPSITFSASLGIYRDSYPVIRAAANSEDQLEKVKYYICKSEKTPQKNKVSIFGQVFNWTEYKKIIEIKDFLVKLIIEKKESRSILGKVMSSTKGFKKIIEDSTKNKLDNIKLWRLAYYLRDIEDKKNAEQLIKFYREIVIDNLLNKSKYEKIENIMIIPAAVRWAELETKKSNI